jgi:hypothetical protein
VSDFETVLERLLLDPAFKAAFAADAAGALAGYDLTADERDLLMAELSAEVGQSMRMEERTSKAALFGLLGAAAEMLSTPTGLAHVEVAPPTAKDQPSLQNLHRQDGAIEFAPINVDAQSETDFYHGLASETEIPEDGGASKDPAYLTLKWDETPRVDGPVVEPTGGDGPRPPPLDHVELEPDVTPIDPPAPIDEAVPGKPDLGIKMAPGDVKLTDIKGAPGPELPKK